MPQLSDLRELKGTLEIDVADTSEDKKLLFFTEWATQWIEEFLNRPGLFYKERVEYYDGTNTQKLLLRSRPVYAMPTIQVWVDEQGFFGSPTGSFDPGNSVLTYGQDFCLKIDQDDGLTSRCGILLRIDSGANMGQTGTQIGGGRFWPKPQVRQAGFLTPFIAEGFGNIKVDYFAGYTVDSTPASIRAACNLIVARMRYIWPVGMAVGSDSYEERAIGLVEEKKDYIMGLAKPYLVFFRNWKW